MPGALREILRYTSPVQYTGRRVVSDLQLHGHTLRRGDLVIALIGAANRDPTRYTQADVFDIGRHEGSHIAFGSGPHVCIGAGLSLLEADLGFRHLMRRWPEMQLTAGEPQWNGNAAFRGLATIPVRPLGSRRLAESNNGRGHASCARTILSKSLRQ